MINKIEKSDNIDYLESSYLVKTYGKINKMTLEEILITTKNIRKCYDKKTQIECSLETGFLVTKVLGKLDVVLESFKRKC